MKNALVIVPARMQATRLPGKPMADIHGEPMIVHVWSRAMEAALGPVMVPPGDAPIVAALERARGPAELAATCR